MLDVPPDLLPRSRSYAAQAEGGGTSQDPDPEQEPHHPPTASAMGRRQRDRDRHELTPLDPVSIPAIRATGWSPDMDELARAQPRHGPHFNEPRRFLYQIQNHKQAWPSPNPANKDEVPDYYNVIASPMDLSTIEERLEADAYAAPRDTLKDPELIFSNCRQYNDATTVYAKYATKLERYMWGLKVPEWFDSLEEE